MHHRPPHGGYPEPLAPYQEQALRKLISTAHQAAIVNAARSAQLGYHDAAAEYREEGGYGGCDDEWDI
jgi:hypothetical protein